jgi:hypothetical protein
MLYNFLHLQFTYVCNKLECLSQAGLSIPVYYEAGLLNKSLCLATGLGVTQFTIAKGIISVTLCGAT